MTVFWLSRSGSRTHSVLVLSPAYTSVPMGPGGMPLHARMGRIPLLSAHVSPVVCACGGVHVEVCACGATVRNVIHVLDLKFFYNSLDFCSLVV